MPKFPSRQNNSGPLALNTPLPKFVRLEVAIFLCMMRPNKIWCKTQGEQAGECCHVSRCTLPFLKPFVACWDAQGSASLCNFRLRCKCKLLGQCGSVYFWEYRVVWGRCGIGFLVPRLFTPGAYIPVILLTIAKNRFWSRLQPSWSSLILIYIFLRRRFM